METMIALAVALLVIVIWLIWMKLMCGKHSKFVPYTVQNYVSHYVVDQRKASMASIEL